MKTKQEGFVLCRRDIGQIGERKFCGKPLVRGTKAPHWCAECSKNIPIWPTDETELNPNEIGVIAYGKALDSLAKEAR